MPRHAGHHMSPGANLHPSSFDLDGDTRLQRLGKIADRPGHRFLGLPALAIETLIEVAASVQQCDADHRHAQVGGGANGVAGQHTQAARVRRHQRIQADLHRKIGNQRSAAWAYHVVPKT